MLDVDCFDFAYPAEFLLLQILQKQNETDRMRKISVAHFF